MKKKLNIGDLKVKSFVTELEKNDKLNLMGASGNPCGEPTSHCTPPVYASINRDCVFTRLPEQCLVAV